jgi:translation initiation factor IF-2
VTSCEAGGITQHTGAYVANHNGKPITFIDTPGHAAFTKMRARGANITDIVILVVAADDSVKAQTKEAIDHAKAAGVEIIVAINKCDKANADVEAVMTDLANIGLQPIAYGGTTETQPCSAVTGEGIDELLDLVLDVSELLEIKADTGKEAYGYVLEAKVNPRRGITATLIVKDGTLHKGESIICGTAKGKARTIHSDTGLKLKEILPGSSAEITGLDSLPKPGDKFYVVKESKTLEEIKSKRERIVTSDSDNQILNDDNVLSFLEEEKRIETLSLIIKSDMSGTLEAIKGELHQLINEDVRINIVRSSVGIISESDIFLADAQGACVVGFNTPLNNKVRKIAKERNIEVKIYTIIHEMINDVKTKMEDTLGMETQEVEIGKAVVRKTFKSSKIGIIAGCYVDSGIITNKCFARLVRDDAVIWEGKIKSLKRLKDDAKEVREGFECGIKLRKNDDVRDGDIIEAFNKVEVKRKLHI